MPELYKHLNPMTFETALQTAKELAENLRGKGYSVVNGICDGRSHTGLSGPSKTDVVSNASATGGSENVPLYDDAGNRIETHEHRASFKSRF
jgi:hypothetical protein